MAVSTPNATPGIIAAAVGTVCQIVPGIPDEAQQNIMTLALAALGGDTALRLGRQKWVSHLMTDANKDGKVDWLQDMAIGWKFFFIAASLVVALTVALVLVLFL